MSVDLWDTTKPDVTARKTGLLTKLHGSIDWIRGDNQDIFVGTPLFTGQHQQHAIIYPGFKGTPNDVLFTYFHDYMRSAADQARGAVFIGFAFRDEYISAIVRERIRPGIPIVLIGLGPQPSHVPFRKGQYRYFNEGFKSTVAEEAMSWLSKGV